MSVHDWCIVLGSEERSQAATQAGSAGRMHGPLRVPAGPSTLISRALRRARRLAPVDRIVPVFEESQRIHWERDASGLNPDNVIAQPANRGSAPSLLLALLHVFERDASAVVTVLPSDHPFGSARHLREVLHPLSWRACRLPESVILLGLAAHRDPTTPWVVPSSHDDDCPRVLHYLLGPAEDRARELRRSGSLRSTLLMAATARAFLDVYHAAAPELFRAFLHAARRGPLMREARAGQPLRDLHDRLPCSDLLRDVLPRTEARDLLRVARVPPSSPRPQHGRPRAPRTSEHAVTLARAADPPSSGVSP